MMETLVYEYATLRYVPDVERGEFVNIGLMMMCKRLRWMRTKVLIDSERIQAICRDADIELLHNQIRAFEMTDVPSKGLPVEERYRWMAAVKSAIIQTSPSHPGIICCEFTDGKESMERTFDRLFDRLVR